jgi:hypothetical protein
MRTLWDRPGRAIRRSTSEFFGVIRPVHDEVSLAAESALLRGRSRSCTPRSDKKRARCGVLMLHIADIDGLI